MTSVNNTTLPTCSELADFLKSFGDKPLFSGNGWLAVVGFNIAPQGIQVAVKRCPPPDTDVHSSRA